MQSNAKKVTRNTVKRRHANARANTHFLPNGQILQADQLVKMHLKCSYDTTIGRRKTLRHCYRYTINLT